VPRFDAKKIAGVCSTPVDPKPLDPHPLRGPAENVNSPRRTHR